jgi:hypothetical protein
MAKRSTSPAVVAGVVCASVSAWSQVLAGFDFPLWLQVVFTVVTAVAAGLVVLAGASATTKKSRMVGDHGSVTFYAAAPPSKNVGIEN